MKMIFTVLTTLCSLFFATSTFAADDFPGRTLYPGTPVYQKADLINNFDQVVIVDARSALEFDTLHIRGALNISVSHSSFGKKIQALRANTKKPIVFYCNGRTCFKSYKAVQVAHRYDVQNVFAYDAGIFEWAKSYPNYAVLLGTSPVDPKKIISKSKLKAHFLEPKVFANQIYSTLRKKITVLDVRDKLQRAGVGIFFGKERWVSLDDSDKLDKYIAKAKKQNRTIYIYDQAGKQVRWLQYKLEKAGVKKYYFLKNGAKEFYKALL